MLFISLSQSLRRTLPWKGKCKKKVLAVRFAPVPLAFYISLSHTRGTRVLHPSLSFFLFREATERHIFISVLMDLMI